LGPNSRSPRSSCANTDDEYEDDKDDDGGKDDDDNNDEDGVDGECVETDE
jgi:hypothetical protein